MFCGSSRRCASYAAIARDSSAPSFPRQAPQMYDRSPSSIRSSACARRCSSLTSAIRASHGIARSTASALSSARKDAQALSYAWFSGSISASASMALLPSPSESESGPNTSQAAIFATSQRRAVLRPRGSAAAGDVRRRPAALSEKGREASLYLSPASEPPRSRARTPSQLFGPQRPPLPAARRGRSFKIQKSESKIKLATRAVDRCSPTNGEARSHVAPHWSYTPRNPGAHAHPMRVFDSVEAMRTVLL